MKRTGTYSLGINHVGDPADLVIFTGSPEYLFNKLITYCIETNIKTRFDMVIARSEDDVRDGFVKRTTPRGRPPKGVTTPTALARVADLVSTFDNEWKD